MCAKPNNIFNKLPFFNVTRKPLTVIRYPSHKYIRLSNGRQTVSANSRLTSPLSTLTPEYQYRFITIRRYIQLCIHESKSLMLKVQPTNSQLSYFTLRALLHTLLLRIADFLIETLSITCDLTKINLPKDEFHFSRRRTAGTFGLDL